MYDNSPLGKKYYKHLSMVIAYPPDIFQQITNDLFHEFEFIYAYIGGLLITKKREWTDYVHTLESTIIKLKGKGLKSNIEKYFFGKTEILYLGFMGNTQYHKTRR